VGPRHAFVEDANVKPPSPARKKAPAESTDQWREYSYKQAVGQPTDTPKRARRDL
jgi:hypothetical protein